MAQKAPEQNHLSTAFFDPQGLADYIDLPVATIYRWRHQGVGPRGIKVGRHVRYRRADVEAWLDSQSDPGPPAA